LDIITSVVALLFAGVLVVAMIFLANRAAHAAHNSESPVAKARIARGFARELFALGCAIIVAFLVYMAFTVVTDPQLDLQTAAPGMITMLVCVGAFVPLAWFSALAGARFIIGADPGAFLNRER